MKEIGHFAFANCRELKDAELNEGLEKIGEKCFINTELGYTRVPSPVRALNFAAFHDCKQVFLELPEHFLPFQRIGCFDWEIEELVLPDGTEEIPDYAFRGY